MKIVNKLLIVFILIVMNCSKLQDSQNPNLISDKDARLQITLAAIAKCSQLGGNFGNISNAESLVSVIFSGTNLISYKSRLYYKRSSVTYCVSAILLYNSTGICDFNNFAAMDYVSNKKLCNLEPDRSIKLDILSND